MFLQRTGWTSSNKIPGVTHPASKMQATYVLYVNTFDDIDIIITLICKAVHNSNVYVGGGGGYFLGGNWSTGRKSTCPSG